MCFFCDWGWGGDSSVPLQRTVLSCHFLSEYKKVLKRIILVGQSVSWFDWLILRQGLM